MSTGLKPTAPRYLTSDRPTIDAEVVERHTAPATLRTVAEVLNHDRLLYWVAFVSVVACGSAALTLLVILWERGYAAEVGITFVIALIAMIARR